MKAKIPIVLAGVLLFTATGQATLNRDIYSDAVIQPGDSYDVVKIYDDATVGMTGGVVGLLYALDGSTINLFDGQVKSLYAYDSSKLYMYGGGIDRALRLAGSGTAKLFGGNISPEISMFDSAIVTFYGYGFQWEPSGYLSGYLLDCTSFRTYLRPPPDPFPGSHVILVPEPTTLLMFSTGALILYRRKQTY